MRYRQARIGTGRFTPLWPMLLLLLVVLVPTAALVWLIGEAVENQRLVVRQKLSEAYGGHLAALRGRLEAYWSGQADALDKITADRPAPAAFAACVRRGLADSVICYDDAGRPLYPRPAEIPESPPSQYETAWTEGRRLEYVDRKPEEAAAAYKSIAEKSADVNEAARARIAQARCWAKSGQSDEAIRGLGELLGDEKLSQAVDPQGRLIAADAQLRLLDLMDGQPRARFETIAEELHSRLNDYDSPRPAAAQRRFLMKQMQSLLPDGASFPTLAAEELAARFLDANAAPPTDSALRRSALPDVWQFASTDGRVCALVRTESVLARMRQVVEGGTLPADVSARLWPPDRLPSPETFLLSRPAGGHLPGWELTLSLDDNEFFDAAAEEQIAVYLWIGILAVAAILLFAVLISEAFRRQMRLTRLRNDLVATVSHELKTPLSSIRLLVDTLFDARQFDETTTREYLELVAKENRRLSRLIDNFLAFSRMERNKHAFELTETPVRKIVDGVVASLGERFHGPGCRFDVEVAPDLPPVVADTDAMVTVLMNLLDNAYKYSDEDKHIRLRAYAHNESVCFEVQDNGIGLSRAAAKKVFRRFYQVDRHLSRRTGGCGLGLSIVQFIVDAHGGTIRVSSQPDEGSTFTVAVPLAGTRPDVREG